MSIGINRRILKNISMPLLFGCLIGYFIYHAIQGERGILSWTRLRQNVIAARQVEEELASHRVALEHRVRLMHPMSLDLDLLSERVYRVLNLYAPNSWVMLNPESLVQTSSTKNHSIDE